MVASSYKTVFHLFNNTLGIQRDSSRHGRVIEDACGDSKWAGNIFSLSGNADVNEHLTSADA